MLIDWDNLQICHSRDAPGTELDLQALIALAQSYGTLVSARAYAEWNLLSERLAVYKAGIEPVFAPVMRPEGSPREGKSLADTVMVADGVDLLWTVAPDVFVLATSDKDMIPLARIAKQRGAAVVVLGSDLTAIPLVEMSNVFITYRQLLRELDRVSELEAPVGRAPARERRLRESRRPSSEPYGGGLGSGASTGGIGSSPLSTGGRGGSRAMGTAPTSTGTVAPFPSPASPRRRLQEPSAPPPISAEPERALTAPAAGPASSSAEDVTDVLGIGGTDLGPRRRRRRGGRGRRTGIGGLGDGDLTGESLQEAGEHGEDADTGDEDRSPASAATSTPDDIDSAVLQLLASRDRDAPAVAAGGVASAEDEEETAPEAVSTPPFAAPTGLTSSSAEPTAPPAEPRRRIARTSFSSFGPPDLSFARPPREQSAPSGSPTDAPGRSEAATSPLGPTPIAAASDEPVVSQGLAPESVVPQAMATDAVPGSQSSDDTNVVASAEQAVGEAVAASPRRPSRSGRTSSRSGTSGRTRRPASGSASSSTSSSDGESLGAAVVSDAAGGSASQASGTTRRRRTRRPSGAGSSSEGAGEGATSEVGA
jgi:hypothetical protein